MWKLLLWEVCHHPERLNPPRLTSWLPCCQQLPSINLPLAQPWPQAKRWGTDFHDIEKAAFPVEQVCGSAHPRGISWCTQNRAGQHLGRGPGLVCHPWVTQKGDTLAKLGPGIRHRGHRSEHPYERGISPVSWPTPCFQ